MRVALIHDYLTQYGGAERVLEELHSLYPAAPIFTSLYDRAAMPAAFAAWDIRQSQLRRLPGVARYHRTLLPLYPPAFSAFRRALASYDLVIADSSAWAHHAPARVRATHIVYCHSPARFLYGDEHYLRPARLPNGARQALPVVTSVLRRLDRRAGRRPDRYIANSAAVAERIRMAYGREAVVIHPPIAIERFRPQTPPPVEPWRLIVSRLTPHKRIDLAVDAFTQAGRPLRIVGEGRAMADLRARAGPTVEFLGALGDAETAEALRRCQALILPGQEDFGMTAVEAQAAGRPVIAFAGGGALESVIGGETGVFFQEQTVAALLAADDEAAMIDWRTDRLWANADRFSAERFRERMLAVVAATMAAKKERP